MPKIYVVAGGSGEYSDHREWPVIAYRNEDAARRHVEMASARSRQIKALIEDLDWDDDREEKRAALCKSNEYDPGAESTFDGDVNYWIWELDLAEGSDVVNLAKAEQRSAE